MTYTRPRFKISADTDLTLVAGRQLQSMFTLSPFVWQTEAGLEILIRAVNRDDDPAKKIARIYHGRSRDGLTFLMDDHSDIAPGPGIQDLHGCEDPSAAQFEGCLYVYYTGWNQDSKVGRLMLACGPDACALQKSGIALDSTPACANPKEATITRRKDGRWVLFFEYSRDNRSLLGVALGDDVPGPWRIVDDPFSARPTGWDSWHLSPGPLIEHGGKVMMFYNGSTKEVAWRIGWVVFDADLLSVIDRCDQPVITPPPPLGNETDIAFAASAIQTEHGIWLYYSIADKLMKRVTLQGC